MPLKSPTFSKRIRTLLTLGGPILHGLFRSLGHTRLTAIKSALELDKILICTPLSKWIWTTEVKPPSNPFYKVGFFSFLVRNSILFLTRNSKPRKMPHVITNLDVDGLHRIVHFVNLNWTWMLNHKHREISSFQVKFRIWCRLDNLQEYERNKGVPIDFLPKRLVNNFQPGKNVQVS